MSNLKELDEQGLRDFKVEFPNTEDDLLAVVRDVLDRKHDYGTCVYAMSIAATAAFNYVASRLGCTGFQASCADLDILTRTRGIKGPFAIFKAEDDCYPQYDLRARFDEWLEKSQGWVAEECARKIQETDTASPSVVAHWKAKAERAKGAGDAR